jgi:hypothetical protein
MGGGDEEDGALLRDIPGAAGPDLAEEDVEDGKPPEYDEEIVE